MATATPTGKSCIGDSDGNSQVGVDELVKGVNIALATPRSISAPRSTAMPTGTSPSIVS